MTVVETKFDSQSSVELAAYYLSQKGYSYDDLCWMVAEKQIIAQKGVKKPSESDVKQMAGEVNSWGKNYDELCWLIAEFDSKAKLPTPTMSSKPSISSSKPVTSTSYNSSVSKSKPADTKKFRK